jgi:hypothetical protein
MKHFRNEAESHNFFMKCADRAKKKQIKAQRELKKKLQSN